MFNKENCKGNTILDKKELQYCLNLLIIIIVVCGTASSKSNFINLGNSAQSSENEIFFDKEIIEDFPQEEEEVIGFAQGLEMRNKFFTSMYHTYKLDDLVYICTNIGIMIYNCENMSDVLYEDILFPNVRISEFEIIEPNISIVRKSNSLYIYNISNLKFPEVIFEFPYHDIYWYEIKNDFLFFYQHLWGFYIFDISNLECPVEVNFELINIKSYFKAILDNDTLILSDRYSCEIYFYDVSNSESIELKAVYHDETNPYCDWNDMVAKDNILIIKRYNSVTIYSYENIPTIETLSIIESIFVQVFALENEHLFAGRRDGLNSIISIYSLADPEHPIVIGESEPYRDVYFDSTTYFYDNFFFLYSSYRDVIYITNATVSSNFNFVSVIIGGDIDSICHYQNLMYTSKIYDNSVRIFDISKPITPYLVRSLLFNHTIRKMAIVDNYLIVSLPSEPRLYFYNISNPLQPSLMLIHTLNHGSGSISNFEIKNSLIFVLIASEFLIIDIETISNPTEIFYLSLYQTVELFAVSNEIIAIYSEWSYSIFLYNYSDKQDIQLLSEIDSGDLYYSAEMEIANNLLIFSFGYYTIKFYDISDPANPILKFYLVNSIEITNFAIVEDYLFLVEGYISFKVYRMDTNYSPVLCFTRNENIIDEMFVDEEIIYYKISNGIISFGKDTDFDQLLDFYEVNNFYTNKSNPDTDNDDMTDYFEAYYNLNPLNSSDRDLDYDIDNLTNFEESLQFSDPYKTDTDSDKLTDFEEFNYQTNPILADSDLDLLTDYEEIFLHSTNPLISDTDQDKLLDGIEILYSLTNPLISDTDADEMDDWWEYSYFLNPNDPMDRLRDLDLDGLTNFEEFLLGTYPHLSDSDNDNFSDKTEIEMGTDPMDPDDYPNDTQDNASISFTFLLVIFLGTLTIMNRFRKNHRRER